MIEHEHSSLLCLQLQEQAYAHKYPFRDGAGWQEKAVKYKPGNFAEAHNILMGDLVRYTKHFNTVLVRLLGRCRIRLAKQLAG